MNLALGWAGLTAIALATVGVYAVAHNAARQREREIAIRMALGAARRHLTGTLLGGLIWAAACGGVLGSLAAWILRRTFSSYLFDIGSIDAAVLWRRLRRSGRRRRRGLRSYSADPHLKIWLGRLRQ